MISFVILFVISLFIIVNKSKYQYKCFLLTMKDEKLRQERFFKNHDSGIPIEVIYGSDTRNVETAREYEDKIPPKYFNKAVEMHYNSNVIRPNITYFNMGAIGCFMGHMEFYDRCFDQGLKYAVIFEDNVIVKSNQLYKQIQDVIDKKGDDFEMCFFHCLSRLPFDNGKEEIERVKWISSTKCYLVHVPNMKNYVKHFLPMDNHVDMKHEDLIAEGARVYYKDLRNYMRIDRSRRSTIGHREHGQESFVSRQYKNATVNDVKWGY
jgi:NDP-sugar pyrophosphorylase family protein